LHNGKQKKGREKFLALFVMQKACICYIFNETTCSFGGKIEEKISSIC
jgi:hypothetical protein